ncbi:MAG: HAD hydrolase-like protein [Litorilituus sp.]|nr:HAD hydrolase-like protein [Litorilituus sp.]
MIKHNFTGVVFDLDNTLVSSSLNFSEIRDVVGCPNNKDILSYIDSLPLEQKVIVKKVINEYEMADAQDAKFLPGAKEVLSLLRHLQIPYAVVTRNNQRAAAIKINNNELEVPLLLTREHFKAKPAPDAVLFLSRYWKTPPTKLLCVGDYLYDIQMANNANALSCLVSYGQALRYANLASFVVNDLNALSNMIAQLHGKKKYDT